MRKADNLICAVVMKSGNLNFLEPSGPLQACNGTDLLCVQQKYYLNICNVIAKEFGIAQSV